MAPTPDVTSIPPSSPKGLDHPAQNAVYKMIDGNSAATNSKEARLAEPKNFSLLDFDFTVAQPYDEGYGPINAAEARVLNQTRRENLANNFRSAVQAFKDGAEGAAASVEDLQAKFGELDAGYVFTIANTGTAARKLDPVEREARNIARDLLRQALADAGQKYSEVPEGSTEDEWTAFKEAKIDEIAGMDEVVKTAKATVKARQGAGKISLAGLGLGGQSEAAPASAE